MAAEASSEPGSVSRGGSPRDDLEVVVDLDVDHSGSQDVGGGRIASREGEEDDGSATDGSFVMVNHDSDDPADGDLDHEDVGEKPAPKVCNVASSKEGDAGEDCEGKEVEMGSRSENGHDQRPDLDTDSAAEAGQKGKPDVVPVGADVRQEIEPKVEELEAPEATIEKANLLAEEEVMVVMNESRDLADGDVVLAKEEMVAAVQGSSSIQEEEVVKEPLNSVAAGADLHEDAKLPVQDPKTGSLADQGVASTEMKVVPLESDLSEAELPPQLVQESKIAPENIIHIAEPDSIVAAVEEKQHACVSGVEIVEGDQHTGISAVESGQCDKDPSLLVKEEPEGEPVLVDDKSEIEEKPEAKPIAIEEKPVDADPIVVEEKPEAKSIAIEEKPVEVDPIIVEKKPVLVDDKPEIEEKPEANPIAIEEKPVDADPIVVEEKPEAKSIAIEEKPVEVDPIIVEKQPVLVDDKPEIEEKPEANPIAIEEKPVEADPIVFEEKPEAKSIAIEEKPVEVDPIIVEKKPIEADPIVVEEKPVEAGPIVVEEEHVEADPVVVEEEPVEADPIVVEEKPVEAGPIIVEEKPLEADPVVVEEEPVEADPVLVEEERVVSDPILVEEERVVSDPILVEEERVVSDPILVEEERVVSDPILVEEERVVSDPILVEDERVISDPILVEEEPVVSDPILVEDKTEAESVIVEEKPEGEHIAVEEKQEVELIVTEEKRQAEAVSVEEKLEDESAVAKTIDLVEIESVPKEDENQQAGTAVNAVADQVEIQERKEMDAVVSDGQTKGEFESVEIEENQEKADPIVVEEKPLEAGPIIVEEKPLEADPVVVEEEPVEADPVLVEEEPVEANPILIEEELVVTDPILVEDKTEAESVIVEEKPEGEHIAVEEKQEVELIVTEEKRHAEAVSVEEKHEDESAVAKTIDLVQIESVPKEDENQQAGTVVNAVADQVKVQERKGMDAVVSDGQTKGEFESVEIEENQEKADPIVVEEKPVEAGPIIVEEKPLEADPVVVEEEPVEADPVLVEEEPVEANPIPVEEEPVVADPILVEDKTEAESVIVEEKPEGEHIAVEEKQEVELIVTEEKRQAETVSVEEKHEDESAVTKTIDFVEIESVPKEDENQQAGTVVNAVADQVKVQERKEMDAVVPDGQIKGEFESVEIEENQEKADNTVLDARDQVEPNLVIEVEERILPCMDVVTVNGGEEIETEDRKKAEAVIMEIFETEGKQEPQSLITSDNECIEPENVEGEEEKHPPTIREELNEHSDSMSRENVEHTEVEPVVHVLLKHGSEVVASETSVVEEKKETETNESLDILDSSEATAELSGESLELEVSDGECMATPVEEDTSAKKDDGDEPSRVEVEPSAEVHTLLEEPSSSAVDGDKLESQKRQPCYIIRIPRFGDGELAREVQHARVQLDQKTQSRDSIRVEIQKKKATHNEFREMLNAAKVEEEAARSVVTSKRKEIDSLLLMLNKIKGASSIDEINDKIRKLEHTLQHESNTLSQEKQYINDIKKLKQQRDQLSSNIGTQAEIEEAFERKDQIDEQFMTLKKELASLRTDQQRADNNVKSARNTCNDEFQLLKVLQEQFRAADDLRQESYLHLQNLRKESSERNKYFSMYKDDQQAALKYASSGDREGLQWHCSKQVEKIMELWNNNDEFRKQYVTSNMYSTLRRLRTLDGRSLGPSEESPILYSSVDRNSSNISPPSTNISTPPSASAVAVKKKISDAQEVQTAQTAKSAKPQKSTPSKETAKATVLKEEVVEEIDAIKPTKEEEELARKQEILVRKEEELRKEQEAAELKEQCRIEQRQKAREAEERKRRNAEKAQARAEFKARKDAELRQKKRAKKERKVASADTTNGSTEGDSNAVASDAPSETAKELESSVSTVTKKPNKPRAPINQINKLQPLPLPLRNRAKRKNQKWLWILFSIVFIIAVFLAVAAQAPTVSSN